MIIAKTVIPDRYWILREDDRKIGNIEHVAEGFQVRINDRVEKFKTIHTIKKQKSIDFEPQARETISTASNQVHGYPTTVRPYNGVYDVRHQVPLWTREERSKSWYAAGWYAVRQGRNWTVEQCPKLIMLERYEFRGPYHTAEQAQKSCCI
jgi:hypothetical protein